MQNRLKNLVFAVLMMTAFLMPSFAQAPKREFRATWVSTAWALDWPTTRGVSASVASAQKKELIAIFDKLKENGFNAISFQVRSMCDAMYASSYEPWSSYLTDNRGAKPSWDPLAFAVEEAHKRGMELHAWLNPYRWSTGSKWDTPFDQKVQQDGWILHSSSGENVYDYLNPAKPEVVQHLLNVISEIVSKYDVDGILFDDYFYPNNLPENSSAPDYGLYTASGSKMSIGDWRRDNVNKMVQSVYDKINELKPMVRFGIGPAGVASKGAADAGVPPCPVGSDWQYDDIYSDPLAWLHDGSVDYISPQLYWSTTHSTNPFGPLTKWWSETAKHFNRHHFASHSFSGSTIQDIVKQVKLSRQYTLNNAPGLVLFRTAQLTASNAQYMKENLFQSKALVPAMPWESHTEYGAPKNLIKGGLKLSWSKEQGTLVKYTVYAVPNSVSLQNALAADGDGIKPDYLLDITYTNSFELPADKESGHWYAVCVYDGWGNEFVPATLGLDGAESQKPELVSPVNGAKAEWHATFVWKEIAGASFEVVISDKADVSNVVLAKSGISGNSTVVNITSLAENTKYYWKVKCRQSGKLETASDAGSFMTGTKEYAPKATLIQPENGEAFADNISFVWSKLAVDRTVLEISADDNFSSLRYSAEGEDNGENTKAEVAVGKLGKGTFYWRVRSEGEMYRTSYSEVRSFSVTSLPTGEYEHGYSIIRDNAIYQPVAQVQMKNLWTRSSKDGFGNFTQPNLGAMNRGMTIYDGFIYIVGRESVSSTAQTYLLKYELTTGEQVGRIELDNNVSARYLPANDVFCDSKGNMCVSNLTINSLDDPLRVVVVDPKTGSTKEVASVTTSTKMRFDYCTVYGDVKSGNFHLFAMSASGKTLFRWKYAGGVLSETKSVDLKSFYPASAGSVGIAPRVKALSENEVFVSGSETAVTLFDVNTGNVVSSFANNTALAPLSHQANGCDFFEFDGKNFFIYPYSDLSDELGYRFNILTTDATYSIASAKGMCVFPSNGLGKVNSQTWSAQPAHVMMDDGSMIVVVYVPGNGLAAYELAKVSGVEAPEHADFFFTHYGDRVSFSSPAAEVEIYEMSGAKVASYRNVESVTLDLAPGAYIVRAVSEDGERIAKPIMR